MRPDIGIKCEAANLVRYWLVSLSGWSDTTIPSRKYAVACTRRRRRPRQDRGGGHWLQLCRAKVVRSYHHAATDPRDLRVRGSRRRSVDPYFSLPAGGFFLESPYHLAVLRSCLQSCPSNLTAGVTTTQQWSAFNWNVVRGSAQRSHSSARAWRARYITHMHPADWCVSSRCVLVHANSAQHA